MFFDKQSFLLIISICLSVYICTYRFYKQDYNCILIYTIYNYLFNIYWLWGHFLVIDVIKCHCFNIMLLCNILLCSLKAFFIILRARFHLSILYLDFFYIYYTSFTLYLYINDKVYTNMTQESHDEIYEDCFATMLQVNICDQK